MEPLGHLVGLGSVGRYHSRVHTAKVNGIRWVYTARPDR